MSDEIDYDAAEESCEECGDDVCSCGICCCLMDAFLVEHAPAMLKEMNPTEADLGHLDPDVYAAKQAAYVSLLNRLKRTFDADCEPNQDGDA